MRSEHVISLDQLRERVAARRPQPAFICDICGRVHQTEQAAATCGGRFVEPEHRIGDLVVMELGYSWFDGDPEWVLQHRGYKFHQRPTHAFWMVVTDITAKGEREVSLRGEPEAHKLVYHVATLGLHNGRALFGGWTSRDHIRLGAWSDPELEKAQPPQAVRDAAKTLVGKRFNDLL